MTAPDRSRAGQKTRSMPPGSKRSSPFRHLLSWFLPFGDPSGDATQSVASSGTDEPSSPSGTASASARGSGTDAVAAIFVLVCLVLLGQALLRPKTKTPPPIRGGNPKVRVWAETRTGLYYCPDADSFGKGRGNYMAQQDAQEEHFRPAFDKPCED
jgi:hypothetical protein